MASSYKAVANSEWNDSFSLATNVPTKKGTLAFGVVRLGDDIFSQQVSSLGVANRFGLASLGVKINYTSYNVKGLGTKSVPSIDFGGIAELAPDILVGAYIRNLNQAKLSEVEDERLPTLMNVGLSYRPTDHVMLNLEVEKDIDFSPSFKAGIDYAVIKNINLRTGINTNPDSQYMGMGITPNNIKLQFDYAWSNTRYWGSGHQVSLVYQFPSKKK